MRIITRGDLDGLTSCLFISLMENIDGISFTHPKTMQDGKVPVTKNDILINLPYHPNAGLWFDHHFSQKPKSLEFEFQGRFDIAPSCARVVYDYYGGPPEFEPYLEMLKETDRVDSAQLLMEDVLHPKGWVLLSYTLDPRSGFGEYRDYFLRLIGWSKALPIEKILFQEEVKAKCDLLLLEQENFAELLKKFSRQDGNVVITDLREAKDMPVGNRFLIYTLFPEANVSMRIFHEQEKETVVIALGHSIFNRTCKTNVGVLCGQYGGGGHKGAGTFQVPARKADMFIDVILDTLKTEG